MGNVLRRNPLQGLDQVVKPRVVVLQLPLRLVDDPGPVLIQVVALLADVPDPSRNQRQVSQQAPSPRLARQAVGPGELALRVPVVRRDQVRERLGSGTGSPLRLSNIFIDGFGVPNRRRCRV